MRRTQFIPFFQYPRVDDATVAKLCKRAADAGVGIASVLPVLRWSGPGEQERQAAVRAWKRAIQISVNYCTPHTFHQGNDATGIIAHAADKLTYVHLADTLDHTASNGLRYIVNPPNSPVRVHQHAEIGRGEVDFDEVFAALTTVGFDGIVSSCVFGWEEHASEISIRQGEKATALINKHLGQ
jgi:sugar phosphate isomerase/epimerase